MEPIDHSLVRRFNVKRIAGDQAERIVDSVAAEEPLSIRLSYWFKDSQHTESLALTMRTPGHDRELVAGFLLTEGIIRNCKDLSDLRSLGPEPSNEIVAELSKGVDLEAWRISRNNFVNASCGICGKRALDAVSAELPPLEASVYRMPVACIERLPDQLRQHQAGFSQTGGLHAAALVSRQGEIEAVFEDIGRHNALDKLIGHAVLKNQIPLSNHLFFLSSRSSFELIQKTIMAGAPAIATVGGPSSLAIEAAQKHGVTLIGFVRNQRLNIYSGDWRIDL